MHRPSTNHVKPSADVANPPNGNKMPQNDIQMTPNGIQEDSIVTRLKPTSKGTYDKSEGMSLSISKSHQNEEKDSEPHILLQTLLDWEEDYAPPTHVCHQATENYINPAKEIVNQESNSAPRENQSVYDIMRELGNILKVVSLKIYNPLNVYLPIPSEISCLQFYPNTQEVHNLNEKARREEEEDKLKADWMFAAMVLIPTRHSALGMSSPKMDQLNWG